MNKRVQNKLKKVEEFATEMHNGQYRKDGVTPYITHPRAVVNILMDCGIDDYKTLASAWLHDVVEDCGVSLDVIESKFGESVKCVVDFLTYKNDGLRYSKDLYLAKIAKEHFLCPIVIKCADRIHNTLCFIESGNKKYAYKYFHKADCVFGSLYEKSNRDPSCECLKKLCLKIEEVENVLKN